MNQIKDESFDVLLLDLTLQTLVHKLSSEFLLEMYQDDSG